MKKEQAELFCDLHLRRAIRCVSRKSGETKKQITERRLERCSGTEGPRHDPYGYEEYTVIQNGVEITAHFGLGAWLEVAEARVVCGEEDVTKAFELITGIHPKAFDRYYFRVHPYREDPMPISDYI